MYYERIDKRKGMCFERMNKRKDLYGQMPRQALKPYRSNHY